LEDSTAEVNTLGNKSTAAMARAMRRNEGIAAMQSNPSRRSTLHYHGVQRRCPFYSAQKSCIFISESESALHLALVSQPIISRRFNICMPDSRGCELDRSAGEASRRDLPPTRIWLGTSLRLGDATSIPIILKAGFPCACMWWVIQHLGRKLLLQLSILPSHVFDSFILTTFTRLRTYFY
jgi:hypothetical protein